ncbi:hypothetical protein GALL_463860 [mine drainage metagenome]|uniref:Uncharacterized protein n=1 Tax=mine drainage metagenome TaxID=410659 RepID=A0A1J5PKC3_9ZZZZ
MLAMSNRVSGRPLSWNRITACKNPISTGHKQLIDLDDTIVNSNSVNALNKR